MPALLERASSSQILVERVLWADRRLVPVGTLDAHAEDDLAFEVRALGVLERDVFDDDLVLATVVPASVLDATIAHGCVGGDAVIVLEVHRSDVLDVRDRLIPFIR